MALRIALNFSRSLTTRLSKNVLNKIVAIMLFSPVIADKLIEYVVEYQICLRLKKFQAQAKIFVVCLTYGCRRS